VYKTQQYATIGSRVFAFVLDYLVIVLYLMSLVLLGILFRQTFPNSVDFLFNNAFISQATSFILITLPISLYFALLEARGQTWGKRQRGLKVARLNGQALGLQLSLERTALKFLPWELAYT